MTPRVFQAFHFSLLTEKGNATMLEAANVLMSKSQSSSESPG